MPHSLLLAAALAAAGAQLAATEPPSATGPTLAAPAEAPPRQMLLPRGTMIRLMVLNEVNSRDHKAGHRFVLRLDEDVQVNTATLIPAGAKAWAEIVSSRGTGAVGKGGTLNARLLYLEAGGQHIALEGERQASGGGGTGQAVAGVVAFGIFGLLMKGNNATLKAGEILNGYTVSDVSLAAPASPGLP